MTAKSASAARANAAGPGTMKTMKAIRIHRRGGPEALIYEDAPIPALQPGDALVPRPCRQHLPGRVHLAHLRRRWRSITA
jgi:hypothetical protein